MIVVRIFTALLVLLAAAPALAQDRRVPVSPTELKLSYAPVVQRVQPAVVNVYAAKVVQNRNPLLDDPIFRRFFGVPGQQPEQMQRSLGSGVMVDPSGLVVTNNHVIEGADQVKVSPVSYTHLRAHETDSYLVCRLLLEKKKKNI